MRKTFSLILTLLIGYVVAGLIGFLIGLVSQIIGNVAFILLCLWWTITGHKYAQLLKLNNTNWLNSLKKHPSLNALSLALCATSYQCGQEFEELIDERFGKGTPEAMKSYWQVQNEFLFFFVHLAMRRAFSKFGDGKRSKIHSLLIPIVLDLSSEACLGHWPAKAKKEIRKSRIHNLNAAELEYAGCRGLLPEEGEDPKETLFWELGKNIARMSGYENDSTVIMKCMQIGVKRFVEIKLDDLVDSVGEELKFM